MSADHSYRTGGINTFSDAKVEELMTVILRLHEEDCQPHSSDYDEPPKRGKKGKYKKDWE